ncbi:MAG: translation initiation factor, partial [Pseudomonadota bacterium]
MAADNVEKFAAELKLPVETLLEQLRTAGVAKKSADDRLSESDKEQLLTALRKAHGGEEAPRKKITIKRQTSEIKQADGSGKSRTIQVEVRKKRVFVKRDAAEGGEAQEAAPTESAAPVVSEQEFAQREAESRRQSELLARQEAELKEKQEKLNRERQRESQAVEQAREAALAAEAEGISAAAGDHEKATQAKERARIAAEAAAKSVQARRTVEDEVAAINKLMTAARSGKLAASAKAPEPDKAAEPASTTLHKPAAKPGDEEKPKEKKTEKQLKASKLSSTWQEDAA